MTLLCRQIHRTCRDREVGLAPCVPVTKSHHSSGSSRDGATAHGENKSFLVVFSAITIMEYVIYLNVEIDHDSSCVAIATEHKLFDRMLQYNDYMKTNNTYH